MVQSKVIKNTKKNPNFDDNVLFFDIVSHMYSVHSKHFHNVMNMYVHLHGHVHVHVHVHVHAHVCIENGKICMHACCKDIEIYLI